MRGFGNFGQGGTLGECGGLKMKPQRHCVKLLSETTWVKWQTHVTFMIWGLQSALDPSAGWRGNSLCLSLRGMQALCVCFWSAGWIRALYYFFIFLTKTAWWTDPYPSFLPERHSFILLIIPVLYVPPPDVQSLFCDFLSPGATRDIGSALTRMCMRHRSIETKLRHLTK